MSATWSAFELWWLRSMVGGGLLLFVVWWLMARCREPVRRQRLGEFGLAAAVFVGLCSLGPTWLVLPVLSDAVPKGPTASAPFIPISMVSSLDPGEVAVDAGVPIDFVDQQDEMTGDARLAEATSMRTDMPPAEAEAAPASSGLAGSVWQPTWLLDGYMLVVGLFLCRWLIGHACLRHIVRTARRAPPAGRRLFRSMIHGRQKTPRLLVSQRIQVPFSFGVFRPTIVVPAQFCAPHTAPVLRWVLAHELTHLQRRDAWTCLLFGLGQALYFFLPWFWWLRRQVRLCQEYIADAAAAAQAGCPEDYAQFLLSLSKSPTAPLGTTGVLNHSSDLYRRVTMLLQGSVRSEKCCPRWWSLATAGALAGVAVLIAGLGVRSEARANLVVDEPKAVDVQPGQDTGEPLPKLPQAPAGGQKLPNGDLDPGERARLMQEQMRPFGGQQPQMMMGGLNSQGRLGANVQTPDAVLADQLGLTSGQGLVVTHVQQNSPAEKAGLKAHDVLLEVNGKSVPNQPWQFLRMIQEVKPDTAIDVVLVRKGKKETVKGLKLPEVQAANPFGQMRQFPGGFQQAAPGGNFGAAQGFGGGQPFGAQGGLGAGQGFGNGLQAGGFGTAIARNEVMTTNFRRGDRFTTRHQEGSLVITVTGHVKEGKETVSQIEIRDGASRNTYESAASVPEQYRDKVENLIEMNQKTNTSIEIKTPEKAPAPKKAP
jgi:beta-lactamase regulating signal transducer with metallopeptidase domain/membrane-associated protease RseP (regulator of RpoE activity)